MAITFTPEQQLAIDTRDRDLLVSAAAGSGKTATLAERIIRSLTDPVQPTSLANTVVVTYTNASADDMRKKIGKELAAALEADPGNEHLRREQLLLPSARISTIDSLCTRLCRRHAEAVGIAPSFRIADPAEDALLSIRVMEELLDAILAGEVAGITPEELCELTETLTSAKAENGLPEVLLSLFEKKLLYDVRGTGALLDARDHFLAEVGKPLLATSFGEEIAAHYHEVLTELCHRYATVLPVLEGEWVKGSRRRLEYFQREHEVLQRALPLLAARDGAAIDLLLAYYGNTDKLTGGGPGSDANVEAGNIHYHVKRHIDELCEEYFTYSNEELVGVMEGHAATSDLLYRVLCAYEARLSAERRRRNVCSFSDVERFAYRLLCDGEGKTPLAEEIARDITGIYIDEFQDVNALQYGIFRALSRGGNLFMVGDLKQSIYGFRHADPTIFATLRRSFTHIREGEEPPTVPTPATLFFSRNFRCDRPVVDYTNEVAGRLLSMAGGMLAYSPEDDLRFSKPLPYGEEPVRTHVFECPTKRERTDGEMEDEESAAAEARWVASEIARLLESGGRADGERIRPSDITLLFRKRKQMPLFAAALAGIARVRQEGDGDFFLNPEVLLALSLLYTVDNPRRDIYLAAVLRSPVFGVTMEELLRLRNECRAATLFDSLREYTAAHPDFEKGKRFLSRLAEWRRMAEGETVGELLLTVYRDAGLLTLGGEGTSVHHDNLYRLYQYARSFEGSSYRGLYNFISYVNAAIERGAEIVKPASEGDEDAVRFMTVHSSKGLEFTVCFLCQVNAPFSLLDLRAPILYDRTYGPCLCLSDAAHTTTVKNPLRNLAAARLRAAVAEEEIRLLYVALTRARERLYVTGTTTKLSKKCEEVTVDRLMDFPHPWNVLSHSSLLSWLLPILSRRRDPYLTLHYLPELPQLKYSHAALAEGRDAEMLAEARHRLLNRYYAMYERDPEAVLTEGEEAFLTRLEAEYELLREGDGAALKKAKEIVTEVDGVLCSAEADRLRDELIGRLTFVYPEGAEARLPEKLSVSRLYPAVLDGSDAEQTETPVTLPPFRPVTPAFLTGERENESALAGTATHAFMQFCDLECLGRYGAAAELERLVAREFLLPEDAARVRLDEIELFRRSALFARLRGATVVRRELRFHALLCADRFTADEELRRALAGRELLVQGVIDCILEEGQDYILIDYKTDRLSERELLDPALAARRLSERHALQLAYYAAACERMYGKPPREMLIYSLPLGDTVPVSLPHGV